MRAQMKRTCRELKWQGAESKTKKNYCNKKFMMASKDLAEQYCSIFILRETTRKTETKKKKNHFGSYYTNGQCWKIRSRATSGPRAWVWTWLTSLPVPLNVCVLPLEPIKKRRGFSIGCVTSCQRDYRIRFITLTAATVKASPHRQLNHQPR